MINLCDAYKLVKLDHEVECGTVGKTNQGRNIPFMFVSFKGIQTFEGKKGRK